MQKHVKILTTIYDLVRAVDELENSINLLANSEICITERDKNMDLEEIKTKTSLVSFLNDGSGIIRQEIKRIIDYVGILQTFNNEEERGQK